MSNLSQQMKRKDKNFSLGEFANGKKKFFPATTLISACLNDYRVGKKFFDLSGQSINLLYNKY